MTPDYTHLRELLSKAAERFYGQVLKSDGCWLWQGVKYKSGYGAFWLNGRRARAHRISWLLANGTEPGTMFVCHKCDVRACVRPDHLFLGTNADNIRDMWSKNRRQRPRGEGMTKAKLKDNDIREIRLMYSSGVPASSIAKRFAVTHRSINYIISGKTWSHVA